MANRTDDFNRANSTTALGTPSDAGSDWVAHNGTWGIINTDQGYSVTSTSHATASLDSGTSDVEVQVTVETVATQGVGVVGRLADSNNFILWQWDSVVGGMRLFKRVGGGFTQLGSTFTYTLVANDVLKLSMSGNSLSGYVNGVLRVGPETDSAGSTNTKHGLYTLTNVNARYDDFSITDLGGGGGGTALMGQICY